MTTSPDTLKQRLDAAIAHHRAGALDRARSLYDAVLTESPGHCDALNLLGVIHHQTGRHEEAAALIARAIEGNARVPGYHNNMGEALRALERPGEAAEAYRRAIELEPGNPGFHNNLGIVLGRMNRFDEACEAFERAQALAPGDPEVALNHAVLLREFGHHREAATQYAQVVARAPGVAVGHAGLGVVRYELGDVGAAVESLEHAVRLDPLCREAHENLKKIRWLEGDHAALNRSYREACERLPGSAEALVNLAEALYVSHDYDDAARASERAIAADPACAPAHDLHARILRLRGEAEAAIAAHRAALERGGEHPLWLEEFGITLIQAGRFADAVETLSRAHELAPRRSTVLGYLTIAMNETGDPRVTDLIDYQRFVHGVDLAPPPGFDDIAAFNAALAAELETGHRRSDHVTHPLDQTMRGGTQTRNNLFRDPGPLTALLRDAISKGIDDWLATLETHDRNPFLRFLNRDFAYTGVWSTILSESGFDGAHAHNEGWMSGTYYVRVPDLDPARIEAREGFIQFGEPQRRYVSDRNRIERAVRPRPGLLVLFPSYYWHGVLQFNAGGVRHAVSFDVM